MNASAIRAPWLSFPLLGGQTVAIVFPPPSAPTVDEVFPRVQAGDQTAFATVYDLMADRVYGVVSRVLRDPAMSEEVAQEVFLEVWRTAGRFDAERGSVSAWILTMSRRRAVDRVRREQSQRDRIADLDAQPRAVADGPVEQTISTMESVSIHEALRTLPDDQRQVIELSFLEGMSHGDIADLLELPLGTVKGRARGGLKKLRVRLQGLS